MKRTIKKIIAMILIIYMLMPKGFVYCADNSIITTVIDWNSLKDIIESTQYTNIELELSDAISDNWVANSKITIDETKKVTLIINDDITINRANVFSNAMFENNGIFNIKAQAEGKYLTLDGNKQNIQSTNAAIVSNNGNLNFSNLCIKNNYNKNGYGGGIYSTNSNIELNNVILTDNEATYGGGILVQGENDNTKLTNIIIKDNKAFLGSGGGIYAYGNLNILGKNTLITNNVANTYAGGVMVKNYCVMEDGTISNNTATNNGGGGIRVDGKLILNGGNIKNNTSNTTGGGIDYTNGMFNYNSGVVENNIANNVENVQYSNADIYPDPDYFIDWSQDESLKLEKINPVFLKSFIIENELEDRNTQGMAMSDKYIVFACHKSDDDNTYLMIVDKDTFEVKNTIDSYCFKHANDITYNSKTGEFVILTSENNVAKFKLDDNAQLIDLDYKTTNRIFWAIAYDKEDDYYIGRSSGKMFIMDSNFNELRNFASPTKLTAQGMGYYGGYVFFSCYETGNNKNQTYFNSNERKSNIVYVYDLDGNLIKTLHIPNTVLKGEIESVDFYENGDILLSYNIDLNNKKTISFYKADIFGPELNIKYSTTKPTNKNVTVTITSNEQVQAVSGWTLSNDKKTLTKIYSENKTENIEISDLTGNKKKITIKIENIDKVNPEVSVEYSNTGLTNEDVEVTLQANESIKQIEGWQISDDAKKLTKIYTKNEEENVVVSDLAGNTVTKTVKITNIDKEKPTYQIAYSTTKPTNKNVTATITLNERVQAVSGWTLSNDKKVLTKTYSENKNENVTVKDLSGNEIKANVIINNIDKVNPVVEVSYSTVNMTSNNVDVTLRGNEELNGIEGWTLSNDKKTLTKTYAKNEEENVVVSDLAGNTVTKTIKIENIDREKPTYQVKYNTTKLTNGNVIITITANEPIQSVSGWTLSNDKKILTKTYTANGTEIVEVKDIAGNKADRITISVNNIDKTAPTITKKYSATDNTKDDVIVTINSSEELKDVEGWILSNDKKTLTKTYTKNIEENIVLSDLAGNTFSDTIKIANIDKAAPNIDIKYNTTIKTNKDVTVTINSNEELKDVEGWTLSNNKKQLTKKFSENSEEKIIISDLVGNTVSDTIKISNIDKDSPEIEVAYSTIATTNEDVTVTILSNEVINSIDGWTLSTDMKQLTKTYSKNIEETVIITDQAGNTVTANIKIANIDKNKIKTDDDEKKVDDKTTAKEELPQTGDKNVLIFAVITIIFTIFVFIKLRKYKDVK